MQPWATGPDTRPQTGSTTIVSSLPAFYIQYTYKYTHAEQPAGAGRARPLCQPWGAEQRDSSRTPLSRPFPFLPSRGICGYLAVSGGTCGLEGFQALSSRATALCGCGATRACASTWYGPALAGAEREPRGSGAATSAAVAVAVAARSR